MGDRQRQALKNDAITPFWIGEERTCWKWHCWSEMPSRKLLASTSAGQEAWKLPPKSALQLLAWSHWISEYQHCITDVLYNYEEGVRTGRLGGENHVNAINTLQVNKMGRSAFFQLRLRYWIYPKALPIKHLFVLGRTRITVWFPAASTKRLTHISCLLGTLCCLSAPNPCYP